jgi:serine protease Do
MAFLLTLTGAYLFGAPTDPYEPSLYKIQLHSGEAIQAPVLYQDSNRVIISLNQSTLQLKKSDIALLELEQKDKDESEEKESPQNKEQLYSHLSHPQAGILESMVEKTQSAVVTVHTPSGQGSGFFIHEGGYLITNVHVIEGETSISVRQHDTQNGAMKKKVYENVRIISISPFYDLALLHVKDENPFPYVHVIKEQTLRRGTPLYAIGNPRGLERSISTGIASVLDRNFGGIRYLQTTVQVNPGNSGGPLFNLAGEVVGVINMKMMRSEGLGFAIPSFYLKDFLDHHTAYLYNNKSPNAGINYLYPPPFQF